MNAHDLPIDNRDQGGIVRDGNRFGMLPWLFASVVVQNPGIHEYFVEILEVLEPSGEPPSNDGVRDRMTAVTHPLSNAGEQG